MKARYDLVARRAPGWEQARQDWARLAETGAPTPFQSLAWLDAWHAAHSGVVRPCPVFIADAASGRDLFAAALACRRDAGREVIEFADLGLTDYNAPLLAPQAPEGVAFASELWDALRAALPQADLLRIEKTPRRLGARDNPLALVAGAAPSRLSGNVLHLDMAWEEWRAGLERTVRKELERSLRVFERSPGARFRRIRDPLEGRATLATLARMQRRRIAALGLPYELDAPRAAALYGTLLERGLASGETILTCLEAEGECVAALFGMARGDHYAMLRLGQAGGRWSNCSPGRLMIDQTMRALRAEGFRTFDFTLGAYDYKRRLQAETVELCEIVTPLSLRGVPSWSVTRARALLRASPHLDRAARQIAARLRGAGLLASRAPATETS